MGAFGVGDDGCIRIFGTDAFDALAGELDVHVAIPLPERHGAPGLFHDPGAEILVGDKKNVPVRGDIFDDLHRVAARADDVRERFHPRRTVDVGHDVEVFVRVFFEISGELFRRTGVAERATGIQVGNDHGFAGIHNFGGLAHEMDAAEGDDIGLGFRGAVSQTERIAHMVSQLLDLGDLVVVREDDGVAFFFETLDFVGQKHGLLWLRAARRAIRARSLPHPLPCRPSGRRCPCECGRSCRRAWCRVRVRGRCRSRCRRAEL